MIEVLRSSGAGFEEKLIIAPARKDNENWVTVFIAENGGRKSLLLRCIAESALGNNRYISPNRGRVELAPLNHLPSRVIAISGTPLDRFPRTGTSDLRSKRRATKYKGNFVYLGQRSSNGMSGLAQSERSLVGSLVSNRHHLKERSSQLKRVFATVGLEPEVRVQMRVNHSADPLTKLLDEDFLDSTWNSYRGQKDLSPDRKELLATVERLRSKTDTASIEKALTSITKERVALTITPERITPRFRLSTSLWELLMRSGAVEVTGTEFRRLKSSSARVNGDQLSSGQWSWLGGFGALIAELRNDTLILIDEPENSLHPSWERAFMPSLQQCLEGFTSCQVVVATHSPLITSGVSPKWGNIRTLKRAARIDAIVRSEPVETAFGWNATDVYDSVFNLESTRDPNFLSTANKALKAIAAGSVIPESLAIEWSRALNADLEHLPRFDPMREIFSDIIASLKSPGAASKRRKI